MNFADLAVTDIARVGLAALAGGLIGLEREFRDKAAGFRTMILIAVGAALFTILSENMAGENGDVAKIAGYVVSGVGFLGAGAILRDGLRVAGLTTAATIWVTAAIGMTMGMGEFLFGGLITVAMMIVLWIFPVIEHAVDRARDTNTYEILLDAPKARKIQQIEAALRSADLAILSHHYVRKNRIIHCRWTAIGTLHNHDKFVQRLMKDKDIREFDYH